MKQRKHLTREQSRCITFRVVMGREKAHMVASEYGIGDDAVTRAIRRTLTEVAPVEFARMPESIKRGPASMKWIRRDPLLRARMIEAL